MGIRVRFAPSPTGFVHIGSLRTALYNYLFAKQNNGDYILRIEDTDQTRYVEGAIENMLNIMKWAGVEHNEGVLIENGQVVQKGDCGPYIQSERLNIYQKYINILLEKGEAYFCFCSKERLERVREEQTEKGETPKYDGYCRGIALDEARKRAEAGEPYVIRLKLPENKDIVFEDGVRGKVTVNTNDLDDQVLMKADGFPTYHFAVVVDDHLMGITHVIRGEEWVISTPKHVYLYEAFGWDAPVFVHLPNILNSERKKLSKRQGDVAAADFKNKGYLPEGLINYLALVGWSPEDEKEIFTMEELIESFSLERVSKSGGIFDTDKLNWVNSHFIKEYDIDELTRLAIPFFTEAGYVTDEEALIKFDWLKDMMTILKDRLSYLSQVKEEAAIFFNDDVKPVNEEAEETLKLAHIHELLNIFEEKIKEVDTIDAEFGKITFKEIQKETGYKGKDLYMPLRVVLTGEVHGPDMGMILKVLGKEKVLARIKHVRENFI
ncbi:MAG: glutamate--tRNA ligase [Clostridiales bacterium]|nr:glutamate--tRNA ligase [Clostridiales bacterium]